MTNAQVNLTEARVYLTEKTIRDLDTSYAITDDQHLILVPAQERERRILVRAKFDPGPLRSFFYESKSELSASPHFEIGDAVYSAGLAESPDWVRNMGTVRGLEVDEYLARIVHAGTISLDSPLMRDFQRQMAKYAQQITGDTEMHSDRVTRAYRSYEAVKKREEAALEQKVNRMKEKQNKFQIDLVDELRKMMK